MVAEVRCTAIAPCRLSTRARCAPGSRNCRRSAKRELRKGFPKSLVRQDQDLHAAMRDERVTLARDVGTTAGSTPGHLGVVVVDPQEREAHALERANREVDARRCVP